MKKILALLFVLMLGLNIHAVLANEYLNPAAKRMLDDSTRLREIPLPVKVYRKKFAYYAIDLRNESGGFTSLNRCEDKVAVFASVVDSRFKNQGGVHWALRTNWINIAVRIAKSAAQACPGLEKVVFVASQTKKDQPIFRLELDREAGFEMDSKINVGLNHQIEQRTLPYILNVYDEYRRQYDPGVEDISVFPAIPAMDVFLGYEKFLKNMGGDETAIRAQIGSLQDIVAQANQLEQRAERADFAHRKAMGRGLSFLPLSWGATRYVQDTFYPGVNALFYQFAQLMNELPYDPEVLVALVSSPGSGRGDAVTRQAVMALGKYFHGRTRWKDILRRCGYEKFRSDNLCLDPYRNYITGQLAGDLYGGKAFKLNYIQRHQHAILQDLTSGRLEKSSLQPIARSLAERWIEYPVLAKALAPKYVKTLGRDTRHALGGGVDETLLQSALAGNTAAVFKVFDALQQSRGLSNTARHFWQRAAAERGHATALYQYAVGSENSARSVDYFVRAARAGHLLAMEKLAVIYQRGEFIQRNLAKTQYWYFAAARGGHCKIYPQLSALLGDTQGAGNDQLALDKTCADYLKAREEARRQAILAKQEAERRAREWERKKAAARQAQRNHIISASRQGQTGSLVQRRRDLHQALISEASQCFYDAQAEYVGLTLECIWPLEYLDSCHARMRAVNQEVLECARSARDDLEMTTLYVTEHREACPAMRMSVNEMIARFTTQLFDVASIEDDDEGYMIRERSFRQFTKALDAANILQLPKLCR